MEFQCKHFESYCYTCKVVKIVQTSSASSAIIITGDHLQGKTSDDVKWFRIINQPLDTFPRNLREKFPNIKRLWINGCGLKKISKTDLIGLENLEELDLSGNSLTSLSDELFADMRRLKIIRFDHNKLERLSSKLLQPIEASLKIADFRRNTKIHDYFQKNHPNRNNLKRFLEIMDTLRPPLLENDPPSQLMRIPDWINEHRSQPNKVDTNFTLKGHLRTFRFDFGLDATFSRLHHREDESEFKK